MIVKSHFEVVPLHNGEWDNVQLYSSASTFITAKRFKFSSPFTTNTAYTHTWRKMKWRKMKIIDKTFYFLLLCWNCPNVHKWIENNTAWDNNNFEHGLWALVTCKWILFDSFLFLFSHIAIWEYNSAKWAPKWTENGNFPVIHWFNIKLSNFGYEGAENTISSTVLIRSEHGIQ